MSALQVPTPAGATCTGPQLSQGVAGQLARFLPLCPPKAALLSELTALTAGDGDPVHEGSILVFRGPCGAARGPGAPVPDTWLLMADRQRPPTRDRVLSLLWAHR